MKKQLLLLMMILLPLVANAQGIAVENADGVTIYYNFTNNGTELEVTNNGGPSGTYKGCVVIPKEITYMNRTYKVTSIGNDAFWGCSGLTSVTIPNSVMSIGNSAFYSCSGLTSVTIPNSVTSIGYCAFVGCEGLTSVTIPNSVTNIGFSAFNGCGLISVIIPDGLTSIENSVFSGCNNLTKVTIPNSVTSIGYDAFSSCHSLTSVTIPNSVMNIGQHAFNGCEGLTSVYIGNNVISIGIDAFVGCSNLTSVHISDISAWLKISFSSYYSNPICFAHHLYLEEEEIKNLIVPSGITSIGDWAFLGYSGMTSVTIPNSVTYIGESAFQGCSGLISVTIPNSVTGIGESAFRNCSGLTSVAIPNSVTSIGHFAFRECNGLISVTIPNSVKNIGESAFENCSGMETLKLPNELQILRGATFKGCNSLKSITIPASVEFIYQETFANCNALESVKAKPSIPPFLYDNSFSNFSIPLEVPKGCKEEYQNAQGWKNFTNISESDKSYHKLIYLVDNKEYKSYRLEEGSPITPEPAPTKEGYTFSGWSEIPQTMPAKDVIVTGTFTINKYKLTYMVDGEEYKSYDIEYGVTITPEAAPTKEGYTFSGWSEIPATMPAHDVEIMGTFTQVEFVIDDVTYEISGEGTVTIKGSDQKGEVTIDATVVINGQTYRVTAIADNAFKENQCITSVTIPDGINTIGDNAFNGCIGLIVINIGKDVQTIGNKAFANVGTVSAARTRSEEGMLIVKCYAESVPQTATDAFENTPIENGTLMVEDNSVNAYKATSPWSGFGRILGFDEAAGINTVSIDSANARIYDMQGNRLDNPQKGVNIIRYKDGKVKKVMVK